MILIFSYLLITVCYSHLKLFISIKSMLTLTFMQFAEHALFDSPWSLFLDSLITGVVPFRELTNFFVGQMYVKIYLTVYITTYCHYNILFESTVSYIYIYLSLCKSLFIFMYCNIVSKYLLLVIIHVYSLLFIILFLRINALRNVNFILNFNTIPILSTFIIPIL